MIDAKDDTADYIKRQRRHAAVVLVLVVVVADSRPDPTRPLYLIIYSAKSLGLPWVKNNRLNDDSVSTELDVEDMLP